MTVKVGAKWAPGEVEQLTLMRMHRTSVAEIAETLGRTEHAIRAKVKVLGLPARDRSAENARNLAKQNDAYVAPPSPGWSEADLVMMDDAFKDAVMAAIEAGLEHATVGVRVNHEPFDIRVLRFHPGPLFSGSGSSAASCVDSPFAETRRNFA